MRPVPSTKIIKSMCYRILAEDQNLNTPIFRTYPHNQWRRAAYKENDTSYEESSVTDRTERLGFSTGYGSGSAQVNVCCCCFSLIVNILK